MRTVIQDLRYSIRQLIRMPGISLTAIVSLALGIGATTAVFSAVWAIAIDPFPYRASDRMIHLHLVDKDGQERTFRLTPSQWQQVRKTPGVEGAVLADYWNLSMTGGDVPESVSAIYFSSNAFEFLGVPAALGRGLLPSDAIDGEDPQPVLVVSYKFWKRHFAGDPRVVGKTLQIARKNYTVVGVAAPRFTWFDADLFLPQKITQEQYSIFDVEVRLRPGVTHAQANSTLQPLVEQFAKDTPQHFPVGRFKIHVVGWNEEVIGQLGGTLSLLFGAVGLLLLIGCGNVSILLMARATGRQHEFSIRSAIGASRGRIVRQLLTESLVISITGAILGVLLAYRTLGVLVANMPQYLIPDEAIIGINLPVLGFTVLVALGTGVLFGLWPALQLSRANAADALQSNARRVAGSARNRRIFSVLIAGQIALTLTLLAGAGAAIEGFLNLLRVSLGYEPHNVMSIGINVHDGAYKTWEERRTYFERLRSKVSETRGVTVAAISINGTPPENGRPANFEVLGKPSEQLLPMQLNFVSHEYFQALGIPMIAGRIWDGDETHRGAPVAVVNQTFARRYFPNEDPLGHSIKISGLRVDPPFTLTSSEASGWTLIVGVSRDKLDDGLRRPILPEAFVPYAVNMFMYTEILVKSEVSPLTLLRAIQKQINSVDADQQVTSGTEDLEHWIQDEPEWERGHVISWLFGAFAALALALSAVGLYSVVSYTVTQRTGEFGIRIALGAQRRDVLSIVLRSLGLSVGGGMLGGVVLTLAMSKVMMHWTAGEAHAGNPMLLLGAAFALTLVAAAASVTPVRRATRINPMQAIRYE